MDVEAINYLLTLITQVHSLRLKRNAITGYLDLGSLKSLRGLDVSFSSIPRDALEKIILEVSKFQDFEVLILSGNGGEGMSDLVLKKIFNTLTKWTSLKELGMGDIGMSCQQSKGLFRALRNSTYSI